MSKFSNFTFVIFSVIIFSGFIYAQPPPPPATSGGSNSAKNLIEQTFTSIEGEFKIKIPNQIRGYEGLRLRDTGNLGTGGLFSFKQPEAEYQIGYINLKPSIEKLSDKKIKEKFETLRKKVIEKMFVRDDALIDKKDFKFEGNPVDQFTAIVPTGRIIVRHILVDEKIYVMMAKFSAEESRPDILKVFDSIEFFSNKEIIAEKVREAMPKPLPQTTSAEKPTSDVEDERLKGKVKTLFEYSEDLSGEWYSTGKKPDSEEYFDEQGNRIKRVSYNHMGFPWMIKVYGYINGKRVLKEKSISYDSQPPIAVFSMSDAKAEIKPRDERFSEKFEYKYDKENRLTEIITFKNNGELSRRTVFEYSKNEITESWFNSDDKLINKTVKVFDEKENLIKTIFVSLNSERSDSIYEYTYEDFDENGNWTKRIVKGKEAKYGGGFKEQHYIKYRTITYYE